MYLAALQGNPGALPAEEAEAEPERIEVVDTSPRDDYGKDDPLTNDSQLSPVQYIGQKAVELLSSVTGHGAEKLLTAARHLAEQSISPNDTITAWYLEYGNSRTSSVRTSGRGPQVGNNPAAKVRQSDSRKPSSRRALKALSYRRNVTEWRKSPKDVVERVLTGIDPKAAIPRADLMVKYWMPIVEGNPDPFPNDPAQQPAANIGVARETAILSIISPEEVTEYLPSKNTAPGPDGFPARLWRRLPPNLIAGLFNMFAASGSLPTMLVKSRTIFVAKKGDLGCPENYRPISIASVAVRHYHRILAKRLEKLSVVDARQRAFRRADGVAENLFLLDSLLKDARSSCKGLCLASLDLSKAFDSVSYESITFAMQCVGLEPRFVD